MSLLGTAPQVSAAQAGLHCASGRRMPVEGHGLRVLAGACPLLDPPPPQLVRTQRRGATDGTATSSGPGGSPGPVPGTRSLSGAWREDQSRDTPALELGDPMTSTPQHGARPDLSE